MFETTATTPDGAAVRVVAATAPRNELIGGSRPEPGEREPPPDADFGISETGEHSAGQKSRPVTWLVVAFIAAAFLVTGLGLVFSQLWLFVTGLCAIVAGVIAGWAADIMADRGGSNPPPEEEPPDS